MELLAKLRAFFCISKCSQDTNTNPTPHHTKSHVSPQTSSSASLTTPIQLPLLPVSLPKVLTPHQPALSNQGWTIITPSSPHASDPLYSLSQTLFNASKSFFALPSSYKETFKTAIGSEEGWSRVEGEKEFITLRCLESTPPELRDAATAYWAQAGELLNEIIGRVAGSLGLSAEAFTRFSSPCKEFGEKTATLLRLFRYEGFSGTESKTVAEAHKDLGLLSLVVGDTPGLEVWDMSNSRWFQIEKTYERGEGSLLVGRQLERLSNGRYVAGGHCVRSYPSPPPQQTLNLSPQEQGKNYRYSIVFVLRAHSPVLVNTDHLTTPITGEFLDPIRDMTARELFRGIQSKHFNINTGLDERNEQRQKLAEKRLQGTEAVNAPDNNEK